MKAELAGVPLTHHRVRLGDVALHVVEAGPATGQPVVLLHGFPETWWTWRHLLPQLARAGYRVFAPDQRGYHPSSAPGPVSAYRLDHLVGDVLGLLDALDEPRAAHVIAHDWGGGVAWALATAHPERLRGLVVVNCPHPAALRRALLTDPRQTLRSGYMLLFQATGLAERVLASGRLEHVVLRDARPGAFTDDDVARLREALWGDAARLRGPLSWYRAALRHPWFPPGQVTVPTTLIWGTADTALGEALIAPTLARCADATCVRLEGVSHWVAEDAPDDLRDATLAALGDLGGPDPLVYKIVDAATWDAAADPWPGSPDDHRDGFVHLSAAHQVEGTWRRHFAGAPGLRCLAVDPARLPPGALRWERSRDGQRFPHLYGPLPRDAVVGERAL